MLDGSLTLSIYGGAMLLASKADYTESQSCAIKTRWLAYPLKHRSACNNKSASQQN